MKKIMKKALSLMLVLAMVIMPMTAMAAEDANAIGTVDNPEVVTLVENRGVLGAYVTKELAAGNAGYYYKCTAPADGVITVNIGAFDAENNQMGWTYSVSNEAAGISSGLHQSDDEEPVSAEFCEVKAGDEVVVFASTYDPENSSANPAGTVSVNFGFATVGSMNFPEEVTLEEDPRTNTLRKHVTKDLEAGNEGYHYKCIAPADGVIIINFGAYDAEYNDVGWMYSVSNVTASISSDPHYSDDEEPVTEERCEVKAGDEVVVLASTYDPDDMWNAPAGTVSVTFGFAPVGSMDCPEEVTLEKNPTSGALGKHVTKDLEAGNEGYHYKCTAPADGVIIVNFGAYDADFNEVGWIYSVSNVTASISSDPHYSDDEEPVTEERCEVKAGDEVVVFATTYDPDDMWNAPAGTVAVTFGFAPVGSMDCPKEAVVGEQTAAVEEGSQGYFYTYTATKAGTVTVTMTSESWAYCVDNLTAYQYGTSHWSDDDPLAASETIPVAAGDEIRIMVNTYDPDEWGSAPAGEVNWSLSFKCANHENAVPSEEVEPGCHYAGSTGYWHCPDCDTYWSDAELTTEIAREDTVVPATGVKNEESLVHFEALEPECHNNGNVKYWFCAECEGYWLDEALTQITNAKNVILPEKGSENLVEFEALAPECHSPGSIAYWYCPDCDGYWQDEACTQLTNSKNVILPETGSENLQHVAAVAPTAYNNGNIEYWYCPDCEGYWQDEACTQLTNSKNVILPATGTPGTSGGGSSQIPEGDNSENSGTDDSENSGTDDSENSGTDDSETPGTDDSETPGTDDSETPGTDDSETPGTDDSETPGTDDSETPGTDDSETPGTDDSETPGTDDGETPEEPEKDNEVSSDKLGEETVGKIEQVEDKHVEVVAPDSNKIDKDVFQSMGDHGKDITIGVKDKNGERVEYSWTFANKEIKDRDMEIDLRITFEDDKKPEIKEHIGHDDVLCINFEHHGELPGPATIQNYVGDTYQDGTEVYLYYLDEQEEKVLRVGNTPLIVDGGYIKYTITHCSTYFVTTEKMDNIEMDETSLADATVSVLDEDYEEVLAVNESSKDNTPDTAPDTGDSHNILLYEMILVLAVLSIGAGLKRKYHA